MKKQLLLISLVCSSFLLAAESFVNPLPLANRATDTGGSLPAIDAYSDGVGAVVLDNLRSVDNSAMNSLVYTYGVEAKANNLRIADQVLLTGTQADIQKAEVFFIDGSNCNDNNQMTVGETWLSGVCQGGTLLHPDGESCNDGNSATIGETYLNGVCQGGTIGNIAGNGLIYDDCEGGAGNWADATNYCTSKGTGWRLPTLNETNKGTSGASGVPQCGATTWSWTSTPFSTGYYVWSASLTGYGGTYTFGGIRCVK